MNDNIFHADLILPVIRAVLDDDQGVSKQAYHALMNLHGVDSRIDEILGRVKGCEDRFYIPMSADKNKE